MDIYCKLIYISCAFFYMLFPYVVYIFMNGLFYFHIVEFYGSVLILDIAV